MRVSSFAQALKTDNFVNILLQAYLETSLTVSGDVALRKKGFHVKGDPIYLGLRVSLYVELTKIKILNATDATG